MAWGRAAGMLLVAVLFAATTACGGGDDDEPGARAISGPVDVATLDGMVLHLPDGPEGARMGDDSGCGEGLSTDGRTDAFTDALAEARQEIAWCFNQLEAPEVFVESVVISLPSAEVAARVMAPESFAAVVRNFGLDCCNGEPLGPFAPSDEPGDGAWRAVSDSDTSALVGWRSGPVVGAVSVQRFDGSPGAEAEAGRLAALQDDRMREPVAVPPEVDDDHLVGLEAADFPSWWLGDTFAPPGLPPMELTGTTSGDGLTEVDHSGIRVETFALDRIDEGSTPDQILGLADELFDSPCTVTVAVGHPDGEATLVGRVVPGLPPGAPGPPRSGWGELVDGVGPQGEPNVWMATLRPDDDTLVRINAPLCYSCLVAAGPTAPYRGPEGLRAALDALRRYPG